MLLLHIIIIKGFIRTKGKDISFENWEACVIVEFVCYGYKGSLFLEFNSKIKFGDQ